MVRVFCFFLDLFSRWQGFYFFVLLRVGSRSSFCFVFRFLFFFFQYCSFSLLACVRRCYVACVDYIVRVVVADSATSNDTLALWVGSIHSNFVVSCCYWSGKVFRCIPLSNGGSCIEWCSRRGIEGGIAWIAATATASTCPCLQRYDYIIYNTVIPLFAWVGAIGGTAEYFFFSTRIGCMHALPRASLRFWGGDEHGIIHGAAGLFLLIYAVTHSMGCRMKQRLC